MPTARIELTTLSLLVTRSTTEPSGQGGDDTYEGVADASAANRTRGPSMATMDFTTKPLTLVI